jgi:hypothetical protein
VSLLRMKMIINSALSHFLCCIYTSFTAFLILRCTSYMWITSRSHNHWMSSHCHMYIMSRNWIRCA